MSRTVKADHRLVQPRPEHYVERVREDGEVEKVLVGTYTLQQRNKYCKVMTSLYMTRHPDSTWDNARRKVFGQWRNLVFATIGDEYVPATTNKDIVKLYKSVPKNKEKVEVKNGKS